MSLKIFNKLETNFKEYIPVGLGYTMSLKSIVDHDFSHHKKNLAHLTFFIIIEEKIAPKLFKIEGKIYKFRKKK